MAKKKYRSRALGALHEAAEDLHRAGLVDTETMQEFDASCLTQDKRRKPYDEARAMKIFQETMEEQRLHLMTPEEMAKESEELRRYGIAQSKKLGLKAKDIDRLLRR
jgi:hypothetical protein